MLNAISKGVVAGLAAITASAVVLPTTSAAQGFGGFHGRPGGFIGRPGGFNGGGWHGGGGGGYGNAAGVLGGLAAGAIIGGALAQPYGYGGYGYGYAPQYYAVPQYYSHRPRYYDPKPHRPAPVTSSARQARLGPAHSRGGAHVPPQGQQISAVPKPPIPLPATPPPERQSREELFWESAQRSNLLADYEAYLDAFPNGFFAQMAKNRIAILADQGVPRSETEPAKASPEKGWKSTVPTSVPPQGQQISAPGDNVGSKGTANTLNQKVLAWAKSNLGSSKWNGKCEQFAEQATYGKSIGYLTAILAWNDYINKGVAKSGNVQNAPSGSLIYFVPDSSNNYDGNVAISDGEGNIIVATSISVQQTTLNDWINNTGQIPLGFVNPGSAANQLTGSFQTPVQQAPTQTASDQPVQWYCMGGVQGPECGQPGNSPVVQTPTQPQNPTPSQSGAQGTQSTASNLSGGGKGPITVWMDDFLGVGDPGIGTPTPCQRPFFVTLAEAEVAGLPAAFVCFSQAQKQAALNDAEQIVAKKVLSYVFPGLDCYFFDSTNGWVQTSACYTNAAVGAAVDAANPLQLVLAAPDAAYFVGYMQIYLDPPDSNYTVIAQPTPFPVVHTTVQHSVSQAVANAINALADNKSEAIGYERAMITSIERAQGAAIAGNTDLATRQSNAAQLYASQFAQFANTEVTYDANLKNALQAEGVQNITLSLSDAIALQNAVAAHGFPPAFVQLLKQAGANDDMINQFRSSFVALDPHTIAGSFPQSLTDPALTNATKAFTRFSSEIHANELQRAAGPYRVLGAGQGLRQGHQVALRRREARRRGANGLRPGSFLRPLHRLPDRLRQSGRGRARMQGGHDQVLRRREARRGVEGGVSQVSRCRLERQLQRGHGAGGNGWQVAALRDFGHAPAWILSGTLGVALIGGFSDTAPSPGRSPSRRPSRVCGYNTAIAYQEVSWQPMYSGMLLNGKVISCQSKIEMSVFLYSFFMVLSPGIIRRRFVI